MKKLLLAGNKKDLCIRLPVTIVAMPANVKRNPANKMIVAVAPDLY